MHNEQFYSIDELVAQGQIVKGGTPLVDRRVKLGSHNVFYPASVIEIESEGEIEIGEGNIFFPMAYILAAQGGKISIGNESRFGDGGVSVKANMPNSEISIGNNVRLVQGPQILGQKTHLGNGSQVIGHVTVQNSQLAGGGDHTEQDPDLRGAVLKGMGTARNLTLQMAEVVNGWEDFSQSPVERQAKYHPKKAP